MEAVIITGVMLIPDATGAGGSVRCACSPWAGADRRKKPPAQGGPDESKGANLVTRLQSVSCKRSGIVHDKG